VIFAVFQVLFYYIAVCTVLGNITPRAGYWSLYAYILVVIIIGFIFHIEDSQCGILYKGLQLNGGLDWLLHTYSPQNLLATDFTYRNRPSQYKSSKIRLKLTLC